MHNETEELVHRKVIEIFDKCNKDQVLLAYIGTQLTNQGVKLPSGYKLLRFIEEKMSDQLETFRSPPDGLDVFLRKQGTTSSHQSPAFYRSLVAAFTRVAQGETDIFIQMKRPFKYKKAEVAPSEDFIKITTDDIPESKDPVTAISSWLAKHRIPETEACPKISKLPCAHKKSNALQRLIEAQPLQLRSSILIPMDIAYLLIKN